MIDVRRLAVLREVARHGSFNQAAAALRITPSAVSQQISALERTLGAAVVRRSTRGVELTDAGRILADTSDAITAELAGAEEEIARLGWPWPTISTARRRRIRAWCGHRSSTIRCGSCCRPDIGTPAGSR